MSLEIQHNKMTLLIKSKNIFKKKNLGFYIGHIKKAIYDTWIIWALNMNVKFNDRSAQFEIYF